MSGLHSSASHLLLLGGSNVLPQTLMFYLRKRSTAHLNVIVMHWKHIHSDPQALSSHYDT